MGLELVAGTGSGLVGSDVAAMMGATLTVPVDTWGGGDLSPPLFGNFFFLL
jgi:hypothetical protein